MDLSGDGDGVVAGPKTITEGLKKADAETATRLGGKLVGALGEILPKSVLAKIAGKKIPGLSLAFAAWDDSNAVVSEFQGKHEEAAKYAASGTSGLAGTVPGWGTAASVAIDLGILGYDIADALSDLQSAPVDATILSH